MVKKNEKTVLKKMSFKDLVKFKKRMDITDEENNVLFYMEEPSNDELVEFIQKIVFNREDKEGETFNFQGKDIVSIFRKCVKGIEIEDLTDDEIEEVLKSLPYSIKSKIETCLEVLIATPMQNYITKLNERFEAIMGDVKELEKNAESEATNQES